MHFAHAREMSARFLYSCRWMAQLNSRGGSEQALIARILAAFGTRGERTSRLEVGPGDDAAVLRASPGCVVLTCDPFVEGVHFLPAVHPPDSIGFKALARATSDLAAMGARPRCFLLSLALPTERTSKWLDVMLKGMARASRRLKLALAGGDTTHGDSVAINITVMGEMRPGRSVTRSGAQPGDLLYVSGVLGAAQLGLELVRRGKTGARWSTLLRRHLYPEPRLALGQWLAQRKLASAMIDLSDGLSTDLHNLCHASSLGARVWRERIPGVTIPVALRKLRLDAERMALHGGDDYELLFTVPRRYAHRIPARFRGVRLTRIGEIAKPKSIALIDVAGRAASLEPRGWDPFRNE